MSFAVSTSPKINYALLDKNSKPGTLGQEVLICLKETFKTIIGKVGKISVKQSRYFPSGYCYLVTNNSKITYSEEKTAHVARDLLEVVSQKFYKSGRSIFNGFISFEQNGPEIMVSLTSNKSMKTIEQFSNALAEFAKRESDLLLFIQKNYIKILIREAPTLQAAIQASKSSRGLSTIPE